MKSSEIAVQKIKRLREKHNYTQLYVAQELGLSQNAYSLLEKGITKLTIERLEEIAGLYDVDFLELLLDDNNLTARRSHSNLPPTISPMEKILYEKTITILEGNLTRLYALIDQLAVKLPKLTAMNE